MLTGALGLKPGETRDSVEQEFFTGSEIPSQQWTAIAAALAQGGKNDAEQARRFGLLASLPLSDRVQTYLDIFYTRTDRKPRKTLASKSIGCPARRAVERGTATHWHVTGPPARSDLL